MAEKKYLSLDRLTEYDGLIKAEIAEGDANVSSAVTTHTGNTTVHITANERTNWNAAKTHADSTHAPSNAEKNIIVGIQKNGTDLTVDSTTRKVNITVPTTAAEIGAAASSHNHSASNITSGTLAIARGGTGATSASAARTNLDVYSKSEVDSALSGKASSSHNHDSVYYGKTAGETLADTLAEVKADVDAFFADATISDAAKDTLKEIQDYITSDASAAAEMTASIAGKADASHSHAIADVSGLQSALDGKAASSHGTHVSFDSTNEPKMDGTAAFGTSTKVARADHVHPTDTSRAAQADLDALEEVVAGKANASHTHTIANITNLQTSLDAKQATITGAATTIASSNLTASRALISNSSGKVAVSDVTSTELSYLDGVTSAIQTQLDSKAASSHSHSDASTSAAGFMTAAMVTKLNGIATGANKTTVDSSLSSSSTNPVQNKVVNSAIVTATNAITANTNSISSHSTSISNLQTAIGEFTEITSAEIQALFA